MAKKLPPANSSEHRSSRDSEHDKKRESNNAERRTTSATPKETGRKAYYFGSDKKENKNSDKQESWRDDNRKDRKSKSTSYNKAENKTSGDARKRTSGGYREERGSDREKPDYKSKRTSSGYREERGSGREKPDYKSKRTSGGYREERGNRRTNGQRQERYKKHPDDNDFNEIPQTPDFAKQSKPKVKIEFRKKASKKTLTDQDGKIRLNKYIANAGICSRREADDLIKSGVVKVNGLIITEMGYRVSLNDQIQYGDQTLSRESKRYLLLNKPKDYITTADDPDGRKTVLELIKNACRERLYPVGRLDRNTTGLLLLTNDGELTKKLTHPSHQVRKVYHVTLDKNLKAVDIKRVSEGLTLEDGIAEVDEISWIGDGKAKNEVGVVLHSGKNRIVRRIFEHLGYTVVKLDRTYFAGLSKKNLARGKYRFLTEKEINLLKMS